MEQRILALGSSLLCGAPRPTALLIPRSGTKTSAFQIRDSQTETLEEAGFLGSVAGFTKIGRRDRERATPSTSSPAQFGFLIQNLSLYFD